MDGWLADLLFLKEYQDLAKTLASTKLEGVFAIRKDSLGASQLSRDQLGINFAKFLDSLPVFPLFKGKPTLGESIRT